jgi:hypothetical protein
MATDQDLEIIIGANTEHLKPQMDAGADTVQKAGDKMADAMKKASAEITSAMQKASADTKAASEVTQGNLEKVSQAVGNMSNEMKTGFAGIQEHIGAMGGAVSKLVGIIGMIGAAVAGGSAMKEMVADTSKFTGEANSLGKALNISTTEASALNVALGDVYSSADQFKGAAGMLARQLKTNESGLNDMGLKTRDANSELRNMKDMMFDAITVANGYKEGIDRTLAMQSMFGRGAAEMGSLLKLNNQVLEDAKQKQKELGLVVGVENVEANKAYKAAVNDAGDVLDAMKKSIGDALMPVLTSMSNWFASVGPEAAMIIKGAIGGLTAAFWALKNGVVMVWETINALVVTVAEPIRALSASIAKAITGDFEGAKNELAGVGDVMSGAWSNAMDKMEASSNDTSKKISELFMPVTATADPSGKGKGFDDAAAAAASAKKAASLMKDYELELAVTKDHFANLNREKGTFVEFSKAQELAFWNDKLSTIIKGTDDYKTIELKAHTITDQMRKDSFDTELVGLKAQAVEFKNNAEERLRVVKEYANKIGEAYQHEGKLYEEAKKAVLATEQQVETQRDQIKAEIRNRQRDAEKADLDLESNNAKYRERIGLQSTMTTLQQEQQFEQRRYEIQSQAIAERKGMLDPTHDPIEFEKVTSEIEKMESAHQLKMQQLAQQTYEAEMKNYTDLFKNIGSGMGNVIKGVLSGTASITQGMQQMMMAVLNAMTQMLANMAAKWITQKLTELVLGKTTAASEIGANAGVAGSAAMASTAAIPIVGPALAPAAGAAAFSGAMSYMSVLSARNGMDIPAGVNPLTQLHEKEMVLPAKQAETIRNMDGNNSAINLHINAVDSQSVKSLFMREGSSLVDSMSAQFRNNRTVRSI